VGHENLITGEIWTGERFALRKGDFIRMFPTPTIKKHDFSSIGVFTIA
jgi:hypothetical protein